MSSLDMSEAVKMLANEKNISVDTLLQVLVDALATAYKRRPGAAAEVEVGINPDTFEFTFTAFDIDEDGIDVDIDDETWVYAPPQPRSHPRTHVKGRR